LLEVLARIVTFYMESNHTPEEECVLPVYCETTGTKTAISNFCELNDLRHESGISFKIKECLFGQYKQTHKAYFLLNLFNDILHY
jgi:hypothetical protein